MYETAGILIISIGLIAKVLPEPKVKRMVTKRGNG